MATQTRHYNTGKIRMSSFNSFLQEQAIHSLGKLEEQARFALHFGQG